MMSSFYCLTFNVFTVMNKEKIEYSLNLIKKAEKLALKLSDKGFYVAFSGGKDSQSFQIWSSVQVLSLNFITTLQVLIRLKMFILLENTILK